MTDNAATETELQNGEDSAKKAAARVRIERIVLAHQLSTLSLSLLTLQPRAQLLMKAMNGDIVEVGKQINRGAALVAFTDFLVSPSWGILSDHIGRRPLMLLAPAVALPLKMAGALWPTAPVLLAEKVASDALRTMGGSTMTSACLADLYKGDAYRKALGNLSSATGAGIVLAPLMASVLMARSGSPRRAYAFSAVLAAVHLVLGIKYLEETLNINGESADETAERKPLLRPVWQFLRLFTSGARMRMNAILFTLHCFLEGKVLQDQVSIQQLELGWGLDWRSRWTSGLGLAITIGGQAGGLSARYGAHCFTAACHAASFAAFLALQRKHFWGALPLLVLGQQRRTASTSWVIEEARLQGVGRGEAIGWTASLRAATEAVSAYLYSRAHGAAKASGRPFDVFALPAAVVLMAEVQRMRVALAPASGFS